MLKFFRLYNKYILVVGGAILMVAFLIQPALSIFQPQPADQPIGTLDGRTVTAGEEHNAALELHVLGRIPGLAQGDDAIKWLLMLHEADQLGLSASQAEVNNLVQTIGLNDQVMAQLLQELRAGENFIRQTLRHWIIVQKYRELMLGQVHMPAVTRLTNLGEAQRLFQMGNFYAGAARLGIANGSPRISEPLVRRFLYNRRATVSGETVLVGHERYLDQIDPPTQQQIQELFDQYRDTLPGEGEPLPFGYRVPDRVKIETLVVPIDEVASTVTIDEAQRQDYYDQNLDRFTSPDKDEPRPYVEVRDQITQQLRRQKADQLAQDIVRTARSVLMEHPATRRLPEVSGYRQIPEEFQPMPLEEAAQAIEQRYGIRPRIHRRTDDWLAIADLNQLPIVGDAFLAGRRQVSLSDYVLSAREMAPQSDNPLIPLRLQVGLPSAPIQAWDGSYGLFRLTAAAPARSPESLDEVRAQVEADARKLAAYRLLQADRERWVSQARQQGIEAFATELGAAMLNVPPTPRSTGMFAGGGDAGPTIPGIGPADALLNAMFEVGQTLVTQEMDIEQAPADQRTGAVALDHRLSLAVFRLDGFTPMTRGDYRAISDDPYVGALVAQSLLGDANQDPLSREAIAARVGFVSDRQE